MKLEVKKMSSTTSILNESSVSSERMMLKSTERGSEAAKIVKQIRFLERTGS
jgi:hypothetical protein